MTDYEAIYRDDADAYDRMVRAEDCDGNLAIALAEIAPLAGARALEIGAGTGRVTELLLRAGCQVTAFERSAAMIDVARLRLASFPAETWTLALGDARALPVTDGDFDVAVAGWVLGHLTHWEAERWREAAGAALAELFRALRPGGAIAIIETLGTGETEPRAPNDALASYYAWLEGEHGLVRRAVRTDYLFRDAEDAARSTRFFFGDAFADRVRASGSGRIPECTGIWHRVIPASPTAPARR